MHVLRTVTRSLFAIHGLMLFGFSSVQAQNSRNAYEFPDLLATGKAGEVQNAPCYP